MKTPRELLLSRHADAAPELDTRRREVVASLRRAPGPGWLASAWRELVWQPRLVWGGLAAVWLVMLGGNVVSRETGRQALAAPTLPADWLQQQRRLYAEFGLLSDPDDSERPAAPGPQSRLSTPTHTRRFA